MDRTEASGAVNLKSEMACPRPAFFEKSSEFFVGLDAVNAFSILFASDGRKDVAESFDGASWVVATAFV